VVDIDYNALLASYQKKVAELINQNIVYEAKLNALNNVIVDLTEKIKKLEEEEESESDSFD
jgi:septal ring factor EnvC (AmiA/AmiB activator)